MTTTDFQSWLADEKALADKALPQLLPAEDAYPATLHRSIRDGVLQGGKRLRSALVRSLCVALGTDADKGTTVGCAVEMYHASTLVLDDLPCMDDSALRRGKPTIHLAYDEATAILAAESLMMRAFLLVSRPGVDGLPPDAPVAPLVAALAEATGSDGLMAGQYLDLYYEDRPCELETLQAIHARKTGRLFRFCAQAAALLAHADTAKSQAAIDYADAFGLAFQISDDILDATGTDESLGKPAGNDVSKSTYVTHLGLDTAKQQLQEAVDSAHDALNRLPGDTAPLSALADFLLTRTY